MEKKNLLVFEVRQGGLLGTGDVEVLVDTNAKKLDTVFVSLSVCLYNSMALI